MAGQWHSISLSRLLAELKTDEKVGLSQREAAKRLTRGGPNLLISAPPVSAWSIFINQFQDFMVLVLLGSVVVSAFLGEFLDAAAIMAIVFLNAVLGFVQEYRAERALDALRKLTAPHCRVLRDGRKTMIDAADLVPGDIIYLEPGDRVPADARLLESQLLAVDESNLTGESIPVSKDEAWRGSPDASLGDRRNTVFKSTLVSRGYGKAVVVATGMDTQIGEIAHLLQERPQVETPLQRRLGQLGKGIVVACLAVVAVVFAAGVKQGFPVYRMFMVGVTLAVAAIPEGLPAVVTIALSVGVQKMSKRRAIVRRLPAVETLGCATVICADKTGTLTLNQMEVQEIWSGDGRVSLRQDRPVKLSLDKQDGFFFTGLVSSLCTRAESYGRGKLFGDPTETALLRFAQQAGLEQVSLKKLYPEKGILPFDSDRKRMSVVVRFEGEHFSLVKGAPDVILQRCTHIRLARGVVPLDHTLRREAQAVLDEMAEQALRVLAAAYKPLGRGIPPEREWERGLVLSGLVGMQDPPRPEVPAAVRAAERGGIATIMVTGDHKRTAVAIARRIGLFTPQRDQVLTGSEWDAMSPEEQARQIQRTAVFARVAPAHKLSIVRALQANGEVVAMTGDGVNDAPAVREADIGVSMGIQGTDVTREASDMVLVDDNYETIIGAIREGRAIYENIRKFIRYLLGCNVGEVLTMLAATLLGFPLPLVPMQILWMNLVTDGLPAIALGLDPAEADLLLQKPRHPAEGVFSRGLLLRILFSGVMISLSALAAFALYLWRYPGEVDRARTLAFTVLVMAQLVFSFQCRSERRSVFDIDIMGNLFLIGAVFLSAGAQVFILYQSIMQRIFQTVSLTLDDWLVVLLFSQLPLFFETVVRLVKRTLQRHLSLLRV